MIRSLTQKNSVGLFFSGFIFLGYALALDDFSIRTSAVLFGLFLEGVLLNYICFKNDIIRKKTALPTVLFALLSALFITNLSMDHLIYGVLFLSGLSLAFEAKENPKRSPILAIYMGLIVGFSAVFSSSSTLLFVPIIVLFVQIGVIYFRGFVLALAYAFMVILSAIGILYLSESMTYVQTMIPTFSSSMITFDSILVKLISPVIGISLVSHFFQLNTYLFRYPNLSKNINYALVVQLVLSLALSLLSADQSLLVYPLMATSLLLSFAFAYKESSIFANALFSSLIVLTIGSVCIYHIIFL